MSQQPLSQPADSCPARFRRYFLYSWLTNPDAHRNYLRRVYSEAFAHAREAQAAIFSETNPHFLLCGIGTANTAETFCRSVWQEFPHARITLFDLRAAALNEARQRLTKRQVGSAAQITFQQGNALDFPFKTGAFDWVETDNFLQFFTTAELSRLVPGWQTILKAGGVLATRQMAPQAGWSGKCFGLLWHNYSRLITAPSHRHDAEKFSTLLQANHFAIVRFDKRLWAGGESCQWLAIKQ